MKSKPVSYSNVRSILFSDKNMNRKILKLKSAEKLFLQAQVNKI